MLTIKFLFLIAGLILMVAGHWILALVCFAIAIGLTFIFSLMLVFVGIVAALVLTGCGTITTMENVYIDNSVKIESCGSGDRCVIHAKPKPRNPHNPYKEHK